MKLPVLLSVIALLSSKSLAESGAQITGDPLFFHGESKSTAKAQLLHLPKAAPKLALANGTAEFEAGRDFQWSPDSRVLTLTADSRIPFKTTAELHPAPNTPNSYRAQKGTDAWMFFGPGRGMHDLTCLAAYMTNDDWQPPAVPAAPDEQLGAVRAKLRAKQPVKFVLLGDSISTGADASALSKVAPHQPGYPELVAQGVEKRFGAKVTLVNLSKGGMDSKWGVSQVPAVVAEKPDLFLVAFGMNDASGGRKPEEFARITQQIVQPVRDALSECPVLLISPMTANPEWSHSAPVLYPKYATALAGLTGPGTGLADVTSTWTAYLSRKNYLDLSGNGLNHPNDFGHRIYADVILAVIGEGEGQ